MRYYVATDIHGCFSVLKDSLEKAGYFEDEQPHKLIICGDLFDGGKEKQEMLEFILDLIEKDQVILIKGNHEDLAQEYLKSIKNKKSPFDASVHYFKNGTVDTLLEFSGIKKYDLYNMTGSLAYFQLSDNIFIKKVIPLMKDYFETANYIFVHGWIPTKVERNNQSQNCLDKLIYLNDWRNASKKRWRDARWINGMEAWHEEIKESNKTIVCGHWHTSFGHSKLNGDGEEWGIPGVSANFSPFYGDGIIALDGNILSTKICNVIVLND